MVSLSIVVPLFNRLDLTRSLVERLSASLPHGLSHEIIFVDDGSTDGTREWLSTLKEPFRTVLNPSNLGYAAANNRGASAALGGTLALINNDLVLSPGWLEPMLAALQSLGPKAGVIGNVQRDARTGQVDHAGIVFNAKGKPEHDRRAPSGWARLANPVRPVPAVTGACLVVRTALWQELGGFDEGYMNGGEDVDLCLRAAAAGRTNAVALKSVVGHWISASPGRKRRDEANAFRLTQRWRTTIVRESARAWTRGYVASRWADPRDFADPLFALRAAAFALGLSRKPPRQALIGAQVAVEVELERWRSLSPP